MDRSKRGGGEIVEEKGGLSYPTSCVNTIFTDNLSELLLLSYTKRMISSRGPRYMHTHKSKLEKEFIKWHVNSCVRFQVGKGCYGKACEYC